MLLMWLNRIVLDSRPPILLHSNSLILEFGLHTALQLVMCFIQKFCKQSLSSGCFLPWTQNGIEGLVLNNTEGQVAAIDMLSYLLINLLLCRLGDAYYMVS